MTITIPDDASPADVVGETDILAGQSWLVKAKLLDYANRILRGELPWAQMQKQEPMAFQVGSNGTVIDQGHHRWLAARLARIEIPVRIQIRRDYWPNIVPFGRKWEDVTWETDDE
jgi:hypothetical protein